VVGGGDRTHHGPAVWGDVADKHVERRGLPGACAQEGLPVERLSVERGDCQLSSTRLIEDFPAPVIVNLEWVNQHKPTNKHAFYVFR
jgi:hypothetical protein